MSFILFLKVSIIISLITSVLIFIGNIYLAHQNKEINKMMDEIGKQTYGDLFSKKKDN